MHKPNSSTQLGAFLFVDSGGISRTMLCNAALVVRLSNFHSSFKPNFSRNLCTSFKLFEHQTVRLSRVHCNLYLLTCLLCNVICTGVSTYCVINDRTLPTWAWCSIVVKALRYKSEGPGINSRCRRGFFPYHLTVPCARGRLSL